MDEGKGKNLVYIHGFLGSSWLYEDFVDYFSNKYRVLIIDHLGHGKSDKPDSESHKLNELTKYVEETLSKIMGQEKIILHGHSMGGMIALIYATTPEYAKRLEGLILMATAPKLQNPSLVKYIEDIKANKLKIIDQNSIENIFVNLCFNRKYRKQEPALIEDFVNKTLENKEFVGRRTMVSMVEEFNVDENLSVISVPTLILTGDKDIFILPEESKKKHEKIPHSELVVFSPNIGHMVNFEAKEEYITTMEAFLTKL
ncbi:MAG: putative Prolyl aminopeptidase [Promethearchaeota archaeon]|nr:MAG: putative Prolyl aminopeptidase [Candidatus Lokiarchaeota archaeon]